MSQPKSSRANLITLQTFAVNISLANCVAFYTVALKELGNLIWQFPLWLCALPRGGYVSRQACLVITPSGRRCNFLCPARLSTSRLLATGKHGERGTGRKWRRPGRWRLSVPARPRHGPPPVWVHDELSFGCLVPRFLSCALCPQPCRISRDMVGSPNQSGGAGSVSGELFPDGRVQKWNKTQCGQLLPLAEAVHTLQSNWCSVVKG